MFSSAVCSLLRAEGFFCNLYVLYGGLGPPQKFFFFLSDVNFFQLLVIKTLDPDWMQIGIQPLKCWIK